MAVMRESSWYSCTNLGHKKRGKRAEINSKEGGYKPRAFSREFWSVLDFLRSKRFCYQGYIRPHEQNAVESSLSLPPK